MKRLLSLLLLILTLKAYSQNISLTAIYSHAINDKKITKSDVPKVLKDVEYKLICSSNESRFQLIEKMESDAVASNGRFVRGSGATGVFYKNLLTKEKLHTIDFIGDKILIVEPTDKIKWILTNETKQIDKYKCYKAVFNFTSPEYPDVSIPITAWYTPEIPLSFGPVGYDGLPGLILELSYLKNIFLAKEISIDNKSSLKIKKPEGKRMTMDEFNSFFKKRTGIDLKKKEKRTNNRKK